MRAWWTLLLLGLVAGARPRVRLENGAAARHASAAAKGRRPPVACIPEWECTLSSRHCDCVKDGSGARVLTPGAGGPECGASPHAPLVRVVLDAASWLAHELNTGVHACHRSHCVMSVGTSLAPDSDVFVTAAPTPHWTDAVRDGQEIALLSLEASKQSNAQHFDPVWLRGHNVSHVLSYAPVAGAHTTVVSFANFDAHHALRQPLPVADKLPAVAAFISNCNAGAAFDRLALVQRFRDAGIDVYSFGACANTHSIEQMFPHCARQSRRSAMWDFQKLCVAQHFRFTFALENTIAPGWVTEKLFQSLLAGSVPIYAGAPDVGALLPAPESAVVVRPSEPDSVDAAIARVRELMAHDRAYDAMLAWKRSASRWSAGFRSAVEQSLGNLACVVCDDFVGRAGIKHLL